MSMKRTPPHGSSAPMDNMDAAKLGNAPFIRRSKRKNDYELFDSSAMLDVMLCEIKEP